MRDKLPKTVIANIDTDQGGRKAELSQMVPLTFRSKIPGTTDVVLLFHP